MPVNPRSSARLDEFLAELSKNYINAIHQSRSVYLINNLKVSIRTTTKSDPKIWYDVSEGIIDKVDYLIYQADSRNHFLLFPADFFVQQYGQLKDSNRQGAKLFYIDWKNKRFISNPKFPQDISDYCCSMLHSESSGKWKQIFLGEYRLIEKPDANHQPLDNSLAKQIASDLESLTDEESGTEGGKKEKLIAYFERNPALRTAAVAFHGATCKVCGFNFEAAYGEHGRNYIEVHHLIPISTLPEPSSINPKEDLTVLCSNCHRMIHRKRETPLSIEELRNILAKKGGGCASET